MCRRLNRVAIIAALLFTTSLLHSAPVHTMPADLDILSKGGTALTLNLYRQLAAKENGNIFFSPYSISLALALAYAGAKGETGEQMAQVLGFTMPSERLHPALAKLGLQLQKVGNEAGQTLSVANAAWLKSKFLVQPKYIKLIRDYYGNDMKQLDFCQEILAQKTINNWMAQKTHDHILELIPDGVLNCETQLVLTNAVYFLGKWDNQFDQKQTKPGSFWPIPDKMVEMPFMQRLGNYFYTEFEGWQVLKLPYKGNRLHMVVLLPKNKGGLAEEEKGLNPEILAKLNQELRIAKVEVTFPKFEVKADYRLNDYLKAIGMSAAFGPQADFGGITAHQQLSIDQVLHKAWVKVEEKGTEAAAATEVTVKKAKKAISRSIPLIFKADHPFLFFIQHQETGLILFFGRMSGSKPDKI